MSAADNRLAELLGGGTISVTGHGTTERCPACNGKSVISQNKPDSCWRCDGWGYVSAPTTPATPVSPAHGDLGRHSEGQER